MRGVRHIVAVTGLAVGVALAGGTAQAGKFKVLHSFCAPGQHHSCNDGSNPQSGLVMDSAGNLFGTTAEGGKNYGTAFELERKPGGGFKFHTIYRFCGFCGQRPNGPLVIDTKGNLYGTADNLVFELSPVIGQKRWSEKVLYRFCSQPSCTDGNLPEAGLTYAGASSGAPYDGTSPLYGVTQLGGINNGGTTFEITNKGGTWTETVLYSFCSQGGSDCTDGEHPLGTPILDQMGNIYGTALDGGNKFAPNGAGAVYELSLIGDSWTETVLYRFCSLQGCADGARPFGKLAMDNTGTLFGVTQNGGHCRGLRDASCGVLFQLVSGGEQFQESVLHTFCSEKDCRDGRGPQGGPLLDASGALFGTTEWGGGNDIDHRGDGGGIVYELGSDSSFRVLHRFCSLSNCTDGEYPVTEFVMDASGTLYGTTEFGGAFGAGTVFRITP